ncbi:MAG: bifunctional glutamate N-acetyltransferase/amino-acid acetyltransferase ArgJ [Candidatus Omnitrophica bacterium]|nr:bifunctional glutamate N-acetyltransferase/amino-acid acetyltransferase ArgJ [Candidatus Omnitrophota bacterium]
MNLPKGFKYNGICSGIKKKDKDLGIIISDCNAVAAGLFTKNEYKSESVLVSKDHVRSGRVKAIVVNSGCANCGLGERGKKSALSICNAAARILGCEKSEVLIASTGSIGLPLDDKKIAAGLNKLISGSSSSKAEDFARAIMTTDRYLKIKSVKLKSGAVITAIAKGAGMIEPNMATTLSFLLTDAKVKKPFLRSVVKSAIAMTFNRISVDNDQSTNDTFIALANGSSGIDIENSSANRDEFIKGVFGVLSELAYMIVENGEGATKVVKIEVKSAASKAMAEKICRKLSGSMLYKSSLYGNSANWGRVLSSVGSLNLGLNRGYDIYYGGIKVVKDGLSLYNNRAKAQRYLKDNKEVRISLDLKCGDAEYWIYTSDLSPDYVKLNT